MYVHVIFDSLTNQKRRNDLSLVTNCESINETDHRFWNCNYQQNSA